MRRMLFVFFLIQSLLWCSVAGAEPQNETASATPDESFDQAFADDFADDPEMLVADPLETLNRGTFWLNDKLYFYVMKPVAKVWRVVPRPGRQSVKNFFTNLSSPIRIINAGLQLKPVGVGQALSRFIINSTFGLAGLFDVAAHWGMAKVDEDFGQTLGNYGAGPGFYLVLPFLGPSSLRDASGFAVDVFLLPGRELFLPLNQTERITLQGGLAINDLSLDDDTYEKLKRDSLDPYLFLRASYIQYREVKIQK